MRLSYGVSIVRNLEKINRVITAPHCIEMYTTQWLCARFTPLGKVCCGFVRGNSSISLRVTSLVLGQSRPVKQPWKIFINTSPVASRAVMKMTASYSQFIITLSQNVHVHGDPNYCWKELTDEIMLRLRRIIGRRRRREGRKLKNSPG